MLAFYAKISRSIFSYDHILGIKSNLGGDGLGVGGRCTGEWYAQRSNHGCKSVEVDFHGRPAQFALE